MKPTRISLVTTCKGRLADLKESLPSWLKLDYEHFDIVVVDFDCPDGTRHYIRRHRNEWLNHSQVRDIHVLEVDNRPRFNLCEARNLGLDFAEGELVLMIDADVSIRDKTLLQFINQRYHEDGFFFSNTAVLCTEFAEGHLFYRAKYGIERIAYHSMLPTHCRRVGLTGTACFSKEIYRACGRYRNEINHNGWGSDDIEFYIRYLNHRLRDRLPAPSPDPLTRKETMLNLIQQVESFPPGSLQLKENTLEEKDRFYGTPHGQSAMINHGFIRRLLESEGKNLCWQPREQDHEVTIEALADLPRIPWKLPLWFPAYYLYFVGMKDCVRNEDRDRHLAAFRTWLNHRHGAGNPVESIDDRSDQYYFASLLKYFGRIDEAEEQFLSLAENHPEDDQAAILFHLGEIALWRMNRKRAGELFTRVLACNPDHRKAREYIKEISR